MIEIVATGMCKDCNDMKLELEELNVSTFEKERYSYSIECKHRNICDKWNRELTKKEGDKS